MILELGILFIFSQLIFGFYLWYKIKHFYSYPNTFGLPVIGNLKNYYETLCLTSLNSLNNYLSSVSSGEGNRIVFGFVKGRASVVVSCPHLIEELSYNPNASEKAPSIYGVVNPLVKGTFVYCSIDSEWKLRRKEINNSLARSIIDGPYSDTFRKMSNELVKAFKENQDSLDLEYHCTMISINIVKETHCGVKQAILNNRRLFKNWNWVINAISFLFSNAAMTLLFPLTYKVFEKMLQKKTDMLEEQIENSLSSHLKSVSKDPSTGPKFLPLSVVIALRTKNRKLSKFELKKELYELLLAGSHTVSLILTGSFAFMATLPEVQEKVWKEQYEIFGSSKRDPNLDDLMKMSYLDRFLKEIMRFFSPEIVVKYTTGEVKVDRFTIPPGTDIYYMLGKVRMDPNFWENPRAFNPDHPFEEKPKYANTAFGVGVRNCPGMYYARQELKIIISTIIRNYKLFSNQKYEDFKYISHLMPEIVNLKPIRVEERII